MNDDRYGNPFAAPQMAGLATDDAERRQQKLIELGEMLVSWEKLRWLYNAMLTTIVLLLVLALFPVRLGNIPFLEFLAGGALVANLCYCAGPLVDGYLTWYGVRHPAVTAFLFLSGTLLAMLLAVAVLLFN